MNKLASAIALGIGSAIGASALAADPVHDWTGFSAGVEAGVDHARSKWSADSFDITLSKTSGTASAFGGYTLQNGNITYGGEVDYGFFGGSKKLQVDGDEGETSTIESKAKSLGSARVKLGYAAGDTMFYATGGVAFGSFTNIESTNQGFYASASKHVGWAGGVGADYAFDAHLAVRLEGLYYGFGAATFAPGGFAPKSSVYTVRAGVVYTF